MRLILLVFLPLFSFWLMFHTFSYDSSRNQILIAAKAASDFGSHLPHIRSFSFGSNWPPQFPLFPGERTRYHFLFYTVTGFLEKIGFRIDYALNLPSSLGFLSLILLIFIFTSKIFSSVSAGLVSVFLFLFNGSFSFIDFLSKHPLSLHTVSNIIENSSFPSFGPWNGSLITAFWNLNIYTNQRHLGLSFAISLLIIYVLYTRSDKLIFLAGFLLGSLLLVNQAAFIITAIFIIWFLFTRPGIRTRIGISLLGMLPWVFLAFSAINISPVVHFHPGYLIPGSLTPVSFIRFWVYNLGFYIFLIPLGLILAPPKARLLGIPLLALFILPNLWQFSADMINNHKLFNFFLILGVMYSANVVIKISRIKYVGILLAIFLTLTLSLGGIIDFFPVKNDYFVRIDDIKANPDAAFFTSTPKNSVVLNSFWFYHPASIAGRSIYNGYSYFTWSYGYNQTAREESTKKIYASSSKSEACFRLENAGISHVELSSSYEGFLHPNWQLWQTQFVPVYQNLQTGFTVYSVDQNCPSS